MWVTANSDASELFYKKGNIWIRSYGIVLYQEETKKQIQINGVCPDYIKNISMAELYASTEAIVHAKVNFQNITALKLLTDNNFVFELFKFNKMPKKNDKLEVMSKIALSYKRECEIFIHTVKAKSKNGVNKLADILAKTALSNEIKRIENENENIYR